MPEDEKTPPAKPVGEPAGEPEKTKDVVVDFASLFDDEKPNNDDQSKAIKTEIDKLREEMNSLKKERDDAKRAQLLSEIKGISPNLAESSKEKSIELLREILATAQEFKGVKKAPKVPDEDTDNEDSEAPFGVAGYYDATLKKWVT